MSILTFTARRPGPRPLVWLAEGIATPPFSAPARVEAGWLLRRLQEGESLELPHSRPMPTIGRRCHELRIADGRGSWRIFYRTDPDAVIVVAIAKKDSRKTRTPTIERCRARLARYDRDCRDSERSER